MKKLIIAAAFVMLTTTLLGCETMKGIGKDLQNTGDNIWEAVTNKD